MALYRPASDVLRHLRRSRSLVLPSLLLASTCVLQASPASGAPTAAVPVPGRALAERVEAELARHPHAFANDPAHQLLVAPVSQPTLLEFMRQIRAFGARGEVVPGTSYGLESHGAGLLHPSCTSSCAATTWTRRTRPFSWDTTRSHSACCSPTRVRAGAPRNAIIAQALRLHDSMRSEPWRLRTQVARARGMLVRGDGPEACSLAAIVAARAHELGMVRCSEAADAIVLASARRPADAS